MNISSCQEFIGRKTHSSLLCESLEFVNLIAFRLCHFESRVLVRDDGEEIGYVTLSLLKPWHKIQLFSIAAIDYSKPQERSEADNDISVTRLKEQSDSLVQAILWDQGWSFGLQYSSWCHILRRIYMVHSVEVLGLQCLHLALPGSPHGLGTNSSKRLHDRI